MHYDIDVNKSCGVGPGLVFAKAVLQKGESLSSLDQWISWIMVLVISSGDAPLCEMALQLLINYPCQYY